MRLTSFALGTLAKHLGLSIYPVSLQELTKRGSHFTLLMPHLGLVIASSTKLSSPNKWQEGGYVSHLLYGKHNIKCRILTPVLPRAL